MELANLILDKSKQYSNFTAETLSELVKVPSLSGDEQRVIEKIVEIGNSVGLNEFRVDGLGNLILEIGEGERILAIDAHIDVVDTGDLSQWKFDPFSGLIK
ncbi:MAG: YgeY family selenium metabolism-linked hydrolase, partial [Candidatus Hydrothermota bacterium]